MSDASAVGREARFGKSKPKRARVIRTRLRRSAALQGTIVLVVLLAGCAGKNPLNLPPERIDEPSFGGKSELDPEIQKHMPSRVAVLPFVNQSESAAAAPTVRRSFYNHFSAKNFEDVELTVVDAKLAAAGLADPATLETTDPRKLGELLGVDGLVFGRIDSFDRIYAGVGALVTVGAEIRLVHAPSGRVVWKGKDSQSTQEGSIPTTIIGAIASAAEAAMNMRQIVILRTCDELFRAMVTAIPEPTMVGRGQPPAIVSLLHDSAGRVRRTGDAIHVALTGDPEMTARATLRGLGKTVDLAETKPGVYEGAYVVLPGDDAKDVVITATLENRAGLRSEAADALGGFAVDTVGPTAPGGLRAEAGDASVRLAWSAPAADDLKGYRIYRSRTPLSGFAPVADTEFPQATLTGLVNGEAVFVKVAAFDRAGNEGPATDAVETMPRPQGATVVTAPIAGEVRWWASGSPYRVSGDLVVPAGASLRIEPGTSVEVADGVIRVEGTLEAVGEAARGITFRAGGAAEGARWAGIVLRSAAARLEHVAVEGAATAITVEGVSPVLAHLHLRRNRVGIAIQGAFAKASVSESEIVENTDLGVRVSDGAQPSFTGTRITRNAGDGVVVETSAPTFDGCVIESNGRNGIRSRAATPVLKQSTIAANGGLDLEHDGSRLEVGPNWWGVSSAAQVVRRIGGNVALAGFLDAPPGQGEERALALAPKVLEGSIASSLLLIAADSPYSLRGEVVLARGADVTLAPGVTIRYATRDAALVVDEGTLSVAGTAERPVRLVSGQSSPAPGDYRAAIEIRHDGPVASRIEHAEARDAEYGIVVAEGAPEIIGSLVHANLQSGVLVSGKARPKLAACTITANQGPAGIEVAGSASPSIEGNNVFGNGFAIQSTSSQHVFAPRNWWGGAPDASAFVGLVEVSEPLDQPAPGAPMPRGGE